MAIYGGSPAADAMQKAQGIRISEPRSTEAPKGVSTLYSAADCFGTIVNQLADAEARLGQISDALFGPHPSDGNLSKANPPLGDNTSLTERLDIYRADMQGHLSRIRDLIEHIQVRVI